MAVRTVDIGEEDHLVAIMAAGGSMGPPEVFHRDCHRLRHPLELSTQG